MKGKIEGVVLRDFANIFRKLDISDIRVEVQPDGWYAAMVDHDNVRIAEVLLRKDAWEEYDFTPKTFGIDVDRLYKFALDFKKGEVIEISLSDTRELECCFYLNGTLTRTFTLLAEEALRVKPKIPALEYKVELTLLAPQIKAIKDVLATKLGEAWGNEVGIGVVEQTPGEYELCLYVVDDEGIKSKACVALERATNYLVIEPCASVYNVDYFKSIFALLTKEVVATGTVTMQFAFEYPLKIGYERKGLEVKQILLAPRIDEEKKLTERDVLEELRTPFKPIEEEEEVEVEIETTATTLYFIPTAKGRLLKPFKRTEYSDVELVSILLEIPFPEVEGILNHLKLEAIWKKTSYDKYSTIVKEEEISREPTNIDALIKIVENYDLMKYPYLEIREYYKHPEQLEKGKVELKERVDALTRYFFGGFGNYLGVVSANLYILKEPAFPEEKKAEAEKMIRKSFAWIKRKYEQIPFSELKKSPFYDDFKPLFEIKKLLPTLEKELETLDFEKIEGLIGRIAELGREYVKTVNKYYKELTGKNFAKEGIKTRALLEYRSREQISDHARWLKEQGIEPNSFEKAAMDYYEVEVPEEEPPWRRLLDVIKELEKEHGLEVPEDIAIAAATEVGIEKPEDLVYELKRDGILYSPAKGLIARVEIEPEPPAKEPWMMTWKEYQEQHIQETMEKLKKARSPRMKKIHQEEIEASKIESAIKLAHFAEVKNALEKGKPVPEEVLKGHPELIKTKEEKPKTKELIEVIDFNALQKVSIAKVRGKSRTYENKVAIDKAIIMLQWHYGVADKKNMRYGYANVYSNFPVMSEVKFDILYRIYKDEVYFDITPEGNAIVTSTKRKYEEGEEFTGKTLQYIRDKARIIRDGMPTSEFIEPEKERKAKAKEPEEPWEMTKEEFDATYPYPEVGNEYILTIISDMGRIGDKIRIDKSVDDTFGVTNLRSTLSLFVSKDEILRKVLGEYTGHHAIVADALRKGKPVPEEVLKDYPDLKPIPFDWGHFIKDLEVKHYIGYRTEMAYGLGVRNLRSVVKYEIEELENTDIIDWTGVSNYIAMIDALYAHDYTEAVWLCKDKQHVIDYYCDGDPACPIEKYEITDGILLSDLGEDGQLVAYQPKKVKIEEPGALSLSELKQKYLAIGWDEFVDDVFKGRRKIEPCVEYVDLPHLLVHKITVGPAEEVKYGAVWDVKSYDKDGNVLVSKGFKTEREAFIDFHSYIRDLIKQEQEKEVKEIAFLPPPTHLLDNPKKVAEWVSVQAQKFKDLASPRDLRARAWSEHVKATGLKPAMDAKDFYRIFDEQWEFGFKKSWQESQKEWEEVPETPQETIARVMKFKSYTGSRPDWQFLLQKAVNDVDMLKADRYDLMRATGKLLGYNLTPEPSNVGLDRWLAQQLANETGQSVLMIGGSVTVEPEKPVEEYKEGEIVHYEPYDKLASPLTGVIIEINRTKKGIRYTIKDAKGETYDIYDYKGKITSAEWKTPEEEAKAEIEKRIKEKLEIPEEKWENITKEKLEETRRTSKFSEKYAISQAKAAKKVSATEETVYEKLPDELDLGPYSEVLLYTPVEEIRYLTKAERAAFIKLVDRGWFQVYRVSKPVSDKYPSGFTYMLKKTKEEEVEIELPKIPEIKEWQDIPDLDAQIRVITEPTKDFNEWTVEIGLQESLGEQGGDIVTEFYSEKPTLEQIRKDIIKQYKETKAKINEEVAMGIVAKSGRDEMIEGAIDKVLAKLKKEPLFYKYVKKELDEGAVVYTSYPTPVSEILIAQLPDGRWNVHPDPPLFPEKPFKTRTEALEYAETNMRTIIEEETGEKPEIPEVLPPPPYELIKKERLSPEELEQLKKDIADLKRTREAWEKQLPGYEARQAIPELDRDIAEYEAKVKKEEKEEAKAEIEKRIKPLKPLISKAEAAIDECDKGFETCLEFCDDDLEACYDRCHEEYEDTKDIEKCRKECEKERDKCHDKCETGAAECYGDSAREIIEKDIEEGDLTKAEEDLETFMDWISDELYKELDKRIELEVPIELKTEEVRRLIKKFPHVTVDEWEKLEEKICANIGKAERVLKEEYHELLRETCKHIEKIRGDIKNAEDVYKAPVKPTTHEEKKKALERAVEEFKQKIVDWYGSLYLIGSVLREEDTIYSDVDVLLSHHVTTEQREEIEEITKIILQDTGVLICFARFAFLPTDVPEYPVKLLAEIKKPKEMEELEVPEDLELIPEAKIKIEKGQMRL